MTSDSATRAYTHPVTTPLAALLLQNQKVDIRRDPADRAVTESYSPSLPFQV